MKETCWRQEQSHAAVAPPHGRTYVHQSQPIVTRALRPYPTRAMLGIVLVLGFVVAVACWNAKPGPAQQVGLPKGIDLLAEASSPKVNSTSAKLPPLSATPPEPETPKLEPRALPEILGPPPAHYPKAAEPPSVVVEEPQSPVPPVSYGPGSLPCSCFHDPHRGETPMLRNWTVLKVSSVLAVAVAVTPMTAAPVAPAVPGETGQTELDKIKNTLDTLNTKLDKLITNTSSGFDGLTADLNKIRADIKTLYENSAETNLNLQTALAKIKLLESQVAFLKADMDKKRDPALYPPDKAGADELMKTLAKIEAALNKLAETRTSFSPPAAVGKIQLVNMYPEAMLFVINGKNYRVDPFTTMELPNHPAGMFTYEVISGTYGLRGRNTPLLEAGKTYTITVR